MATEGRSLHDAEGLRWRVASGRIEGQRGRSPRRSTGTANVSTATSNTLVLAHSGLAVATEKDNGAHLARRRTTLCTQIGIFRVLERTTSESCGTSKTREIREAQPWYCAHRASSGKQPGIMGKRQWADGGGRDAADSPLIASFQSGNGFAPREAEIAKKRRISALADRADERTGRSSLRAGAQGDRENTASQQSTKSSAATPSGRGKGANGAAARTGAGTAERARGWDGSGESGEDDDRVWQTYGTRPVMYGFRGRDGAWIWDCCKVLFVRRG